jgi:hypothetical protein
MINPIRVESACPANEAVNFIAFVEQKLSQIGTVLPCDTRDKRPLHYFTPQSL